MGIQSSFLLLPEFALKCLNRGLEYQNRGGP